MLKKTTLIITGCIKPQTNIQLAVDDINERIEQYFSCVEYFLQSNGFKNIVFCENSDCYQLDIDRLNKLAHEMGKGFEYLTFAGSSDMIKKYGKGYGEGEIIQYAMKHSDLIKEASGFFKITGRLKITNIDKILKHVNLSHNYFNRTELLRNSSLIDTRFFYCLKSDYSSNLLAAYKNVDDSKEWYIEKEFYKQLYLKKIPHKCFPLYPRFMGVAGSSGTVYGQEDKLKMKMRDILSLLGLFS